jgi:hypothetical protein
MTHGIICIKTFPPTPLISMSYISLLPCHGILRNFWGIGGHGKAHAVISEKL